MHPLACVHLIRHMVFNSVVAQNALVPTSLSAGQPVSRQCSSHCMGPTQVGGACDPNIKPRRSMSIRMRAFSSFLPPARHNLLTSIVASTMGEHYSFRLMQLLNHSLIDLKVARKPPVAGVVSMPQATSYIPNEPPFPGRSRCRWSR
jgi:hypothetical protein